MGYDSPMAERVKVNDEFRDIRPDLRERLEEALHRRDRHLAQVKSAEVDIQAYQGMIEREDARYNARAADVPKPPSDALASFVFKALLMRPQSKEDLRHSAANAGYDVDGRSIHAVTVNLVRTGKIKELKDGVFGVDAERAAAH
jgi:hypothetical protein